jgi:serine/threonine protein kinase
VDAELPSLGAELVAAGWGPFDQLEFLGAGRFGETYRAERGGVEFALKICHFLPVMPEELWRREVSAQQRVLHPNIVRFRQAGRVRAGGRVYPYMECEYVAGGDVAGLIAAGRRPDAPAELRALFVGMLRGVNELHALGILHRDIRPSNVALRGGEWGAPVLLDFGLAQPLCHSAAHQRLSLSSRRPDLAGVAAVVYEAGTGRRPGEPDTPVAGASITNGRKRAVIDPRELSALFDDDVAELVVRLLSRRHRLGADDALRALGAL